jgi:hypothetical protein
LRISKPPKTTILRKENKWRMIAAYPHNLHCPPALFITLPA